MDLRPSFVAHTTDGDGTSTYSTSSACVGCRACTAPAPPRITSIGRTNLCHHQGARTCGEAADGLPHGALQRNLHQLGRGDQWLHCKQGERQIPRHEIPQHHSLYRDNRMRCRLAWAGSSAFGIDPRGAVRGTVTHRPGAVAQRCLSRRAP